MTKLFVSGNSARQISKNLLLEIVEALKNIRGWGSVEIFVQDHKVVQITERNIKKTQHVIRDGDNPDS